MHRLSDTADAPGSELLPGARVLLVRQLEEWQPAVFVLVLVVMLALVGGNTVWRASRWSRRTGPADAEQRSR